ncbi:MAG: bactofilin family protein [Ignavibacteriaceae bacterium]
MGRMLLILVLGGGMLFSVANLNINTSNVAMATNAYVAYQNAQAKDYARSGVEIAIKNLSVDTTYTGTTSKQLTGGTVTITVQNTSSQFYNGPDMSLSSARLVTSISQVGSLTDTIRTVIQLPTASSNPIVPPFLNYAVATGGNLTMNGNVTIRDDYNSQWNANIQTNNNFQMEGNPSIKGFLTYVGNASSNPSSRLNTNIVPNQNPNNLVSHSQGPAVTIPTFNPDTYISEAGLIYQSDANLSGNITLGSKASPEIIYVNGDLNLSGNTTLTGYGVFIVKGNILVNGNVTINGQDANGSNVGLYCTGDLNANGNVSISAQILTGGNANLNGNVNVYGNITSSGVVNFNGNNTIYYKPASAALTQPFWPQSGGSTATRPSIISYYE